MVLRTAKRRVEEVERTLLNLPQPTYPLEVGDKREAFVDIDIGQIRTEEIKMATKKLKNGKVDEDMD